MNLSPRCHGLIFVALMIVWTVALLIPKPGRAVAGTIDHPTALFFISKALHIGAYAFLTFVGGYIISSRTGAWLILGLLSLHAASTEFLQQFVGRGATFRDVGLDHVGIAIGVAASWPQWRVLRTPARH